MASASSGPVPAGTSCQGSPDAAGHHDKFPACLCKANWPQLVEACVLPLTRLEISSGVVLLRCLSSLRRWLQALYSPSSGRAAMCPVVFKLASLVHAHKFFVLLACQKLLRNPDASKHLHYAARRLLDAVLKLLPCQEGELCLRSCAPFLDQFLKADSSGPGPPLAIEELFQEVVLVHSLPLNSSPGAGRCLRASEPSSWHTDMLKHAAVSRLRHDWKKHVSMLASHDKPGQSQDRRLVFLNLWKTLVCVKSNIGIALSREIISSSVKLIPEIFKEKPVLTWRKELDVLQEVLCYGSTLALQSEVNPEVSTVSQSIIKTALASKFLNDISKVPRSSSGFLGEQVLVPTGRATVINQQFIQGLTLLLLKATAVILREATSCSSMSEESDASATSRGSFCEEEMRLIEGNVDCLLRSLHGWIKDLKNFHPNQSFGESIVELFFTQDDYAIEALLCLVDIHSGLDYFSLEVVSLDLDPIKTFHYYMEKCSWDTSIIVDFLVSNETCFLLYMLKLLKHIVKKPPTFGFSKEMSECLSSLENSLQKLIKSNLFPYNINPIMCLLNKINSG